MRLVWVHHPEVGKTQVPESAVPIMRQSGWDPLSDDEVAALERDLHQQAAAAEKAMTEGAPPPDKPESVPAPGPGPASRKSGSKENS